jgi:hypothetical protein
VVVDAEVVVDVDGNKRITRYFVHDHDHDHDCVQD